MGYVTHLIYTPLIAFMALAAETFAQGTPPPAAIMPDFTFRTAPGKTLTPADIPRDKPALIVFVDVDCDHCRQAVQEMNDSAALLSRVHLYIASLAAAPQLKAFAGKYGPRLKAEWLSDPDARNMVRFNPVRYPAMFLYSPDKRLLDYEDNVETIFRIERSIRAFRRL
jgi:peroxiredoxin